MSDTASTGNPGELDDYGAGGFDDELPGRPRRQLLNRWSAGLLALLVGAIGFYVGVRVEKGSISSASSPSFSLAAVTAAARATGGSGSGAQGSGTSGRSGTTGGRFAGAGGFAGAGPAGVGGANVAVGTVSSVDGEKIYVKEADGNTVEVKLSSATSISKRETIGRDRLYPGDAVVIEAAKGSGSELVATSITDSGASSTATTGTGASSSNGGESSVIGSLFSRR